MINLFQTKSHHYPVYFVNGIIFLLLCFNLSVIGQENNYISKLRANIEFTQYLISSQKYDDAIFLINSLDLHNLKNTGIVDSLNFFKGWAMYNIKDLDSSSNYLLKVTPNSSFYLKSRFFSTYNYLYLNKLPLACENLENLEVSDIHNELKDLELAGASLLKRDYTAFDQYSKTFSKNWFALVNAEESLNATALKLRKYKPKSMIVAGLMSAVIPGSGKMYSGKIGEGISALLSTSILASITLENYQKAGINNFKTIFFGSLFSIFYVGNIYGSMISVKVTTNEFYSSNDKNILFNIHIPIRTIFN